MEKGMEIKWSDRRTILVLYLSAMSLNLKCSRDWRLIQCFLCTAQCIAGGAGSPHSLRHNNDGVCARSALPSVSLTFVTNMITKGVNVAIIFTILREGAFFLFNAFTLHTILSILTCFLPIKLERLCLIVCIKNSVL